MFDGPKPPQKPEEIGGKTSIEDAVLKQVPGRLGRYTSVRLGQEPWSWSYKNSRIAQVPVFRTRRLDLGHVLDL